MNEKQHPSYEPDEEKLREYVYDLPSGMQNLIDGSALSAAKRVEAPASITSKVNEKLSVDPVSNGNLFDREPHTGIHALGYSGDRQLNLLIGNTASDDVSEVNMRTRRDEVSRQVIPERLGEIESERKVLQDTYARKGRIGRALGKNALNVKTVKLEQERAQIRRHENTLPTYQTIDEMNRYLTSDPRTSAILHDEAKLLANLDGKEIKE